MTRKTFVIDTNVLLHDPQSLFQFEGQNIVLPLVVLEELDKLKRYSDELGKNARTVIRTIEALKGQGNLQEGISLGKETTLRILSDVEKRDKIFFPLALDHSPNKILYSAKILKEEGEPVVLVSKDVVMRVKAESIGLDAEDYQSRKEAFDTLYKGIRKIDKPKVQIDRFYLDGHIETDEKNFYPNEYCVMSSPEQSSAVSKYNHKSDKLEPLLALKRDVWGIHPLNVEQRCAVDLLLRDDIKLVTLVGKAGTGKTILALACALRKVFDEGTYRRILISRPIMPLGKDIGYLPGTKEEKLFHWMQPIYDNLEYLCETTDGSNTGEDTKNWILESGKIEVEAVTYIRGRSLANAFIIIDEAQNLTPHEVKTVVSRAGHGTKIILTGDPTQIDNPYLDKDSNALTYIVGKLKNHPIYGHVLLEKTERSELAALAAELL